MKKILTVLGARPQFIKASVVSTQIADSSSLDEVIVHTGQHFDANMSDVFFEELGMRTPKYQLNINGGAHGEMTGRMLIEVEKVVLSERPDIVLVYGDTNSTLAGALVASKLHIPVAHVEAGLRSRNLKMPEEINRILTDRVSTWLFTPTESATKNLLQEGVSETAIYQVGDVMYDVALQHGAKVSSDGRILGQLSLNPKEYILATIHRAENTDNDTVLQGIVEALSSVANNIMPIVWPVHPRTKGRLQSLGLLESISTELLLVEPVGYLDMVQLEKYSSLVITDSGGVQKEAFFHGVPCITLRQETEWVELVEAGWNMLVSPKSNNMEVILEAVYEGIEATPAEIFPYGDGTAALAISKLLH
ncbi:non-hydrolyzing UDP-N-acetylglucosamine 2-epimerase [Neopusillimonas maritima]|uniref:UDP-N-acetylglucosamine 2-epimerase (Non-hydrolyzing) n=1 Tax=Neopusillimonas maritima TaxID=2026239 RepID=A0A3A1YYP0_9BURK|nr:UDP-N-acetylglucosamine 2-epimerase (non-hydrolyzing) [Neopusillimonas maritima]RIY41604.1 UDP-N-acetylglucosamine 2-epimerase (non-hydrolyzing) [Neopusillimonas maritima]